MLLTSLDQLDLTDSLEKLDLEGGVVMIPRDQFYQAEWDTLIGPESRPVQILNSDCWNLTMLPTRSLP